MFDPQDKTIPLDLDSVRFEELGRAPIVGVATDRELFADLPQCIPAPALISRCNGDSREFLSQDFREGLV